MFKDEKRAFSDLEKELRGMNAPEPEDDLADIYALLDKDYTKQPEPAAEVQELAIPAEPAAEEDGEVAEGPDAQGRPGAVRHRPPQWRRPF